MIDPMFLKPLDWRFVKKHFGFSLALMALAFFGGVLLAALVTP